MNSITDFYQRCGMEAKSYATRWTHLAEIKIDDFHRNIALCDQCAVRLRNLVREELLEPGSVARANERKKKRQ